MSDERLSVSEPRATSAPDTPAEPDSPSARPDRSAPASRPLDLPREYGGRKGPEPVRYGDWEKNGRCIDF